MPLTPNGPAPYPPYGKVVQVIEQHRHVGLATPITRENVARLIDSDGLAPRVMRALHLFDLIDERGQPTPRFEALVDAPTEEEFRQRFATILRAAYADVFQYLSDPRASSAERLDSLFRSYEPRGQRDRMVACFRGLCEYVGIMDAPDGAPAGQPPPTTRRRPARTRIPLSAASFATADGGTLPADPTGLHPFLQVLLAQLPEIGAVWPAERREDWTDLAAAGFRLLYQPSPEDETASAEEVGQASAP
ncbi:MAG: DUF5343 domain-containing protein [Solirubrobacteraceae bacterium]